MGPKIPLSSVFTWCLLPSILPNMNAPIDVQFRAFTPGVKFADNATVRLDLGNEPQPDGVLLIEPARGGQVRISKDGYIEGGPELAGEIAASSASIDLHDKLHAYERNGIREYVV